jgi:hypothetical protein
MAVTRPIGKSWGAGGSATVGLARIGGALAWTVASAVAAALALMFAATMVLIAIPAGVFVLIAASVLRDRASKRAGVVDSDVIEARHVGGHSWVACGWDGRS